ncbi:MAG: pyridoxal phosphate-dependent aminotransferase [Anaerolineae bacterium]|nr:pyridoxal phosphate-dependent aminotransferase [Anaerolineae bacterium]
MPLAATLDLSPNRIELARRAKSGHYIDLTSSNPTQHGLLFPPEILQNAAAGYWHTRHYDPSPRGLWPARQAIAKYYASRGYAIDPAHIFITASTSEAYGLLFALLTTPNDNVIGPSVTYPLFEHLAALYHIELRSYALDKTLDWQIDHAHLQANINERTRAILLVSPHNPTGATYDVQSLNQHANIRHLPIICDEVFAEFAFGMPRTPPAALHCPNMPVFMLNGISKMFALPDLKLGWIALNPPAAAQFAERLELINDTFLSANSLTQFMLPALFEHGMGFVSDMRRHINANLRMALAQLRTCARLKVHTPDGGYYLFPEVRDWHGSADDLILHLLDAGVFVYPGYFYNCNDGHHLMISCLTAPDQLAEGLRRLTDALA